jgi:hypothetical protein
MIILRNQSLTLECPASGYPIPITRWLETVLIIFILIYFYFDIGIKMK